MALKIRALKPNDIPQVMELHSKFHSDGYLPDLMSFLCSFVVTDDNNRIIVGGGVRAVGETIIATDKEYPNMTTVGRALVEAQRASMFICGRFGIGLLHALIKDNEPYAKHLIQHGFFEREGKLLALKVGSNER